MPNQMPAPFHEVTPSLSRGADQETDTPQTLLIRLNGILNEIATLQKVMEAAHNVAASQYLKNAAKQINHAQQMFHR
jgi:hypothetical protein